MRYIVKIFKVKPEEEHKMRNQILYSFQYPDQFDLDNYYNVVLEEANMDLSIYPSEKEMLKSLEVLLQVDGKKPFSCCDVVLIIDETKKHRIICFTKKGDFVSI